MGEEQFAELVDKYYAALYRFALSLARNTADAGDLTQQTFLVWATKGQSMRDPTKAKTWLFTTLYREFLRGRRRSFRITAIEDLAPTNQDLADVEVDVVAKIDAQLIMEALQELEHIFRDPLSLFYLQDLSYVEIASILSVPVGTVMSRLSRGKIQLRMLLADKNKANNVIAFHNTNQNK
jgi:RNA polymerase sigma-70 factor (ECF subfamily)